MPSGATRRASGGDFLLHDIGPVEDRTFLFGDQSNIRSLATAEVWGETEYSRPPRPSGSRCIRPTRRLRSTASRAYTPLLPNKSQETYNRMWSEISTLIGEEIDRARICIVGFERASINAFLGKFQAASVAGCIFHLRQALYRKAQELGISGKCQAGDDFRLRVKTLAVLAPPPLKR